MTMYNTRIELHRLDGAQHRQTYEKLHAAMERAGFTRTIVGGNGRTYQLPHAEYEKVTGDALERVQAQAKGVANSVHTPNGVITWQYAAAQWEGLAEV